MSMSQEEIEALMNETTDLVDSAEPIEDENTEEEPEEIESKEVEPEEVETETESSMTIDDIESLVESTDVESLTEESEEEASTSDDMDILLSSIDGITDDHEELVPKEDISAKIEEGVYPLPVEKEHKIVNQLHEVAEDTEEKATQIFDVLNFILDENDVIEKNVKDTNEFLEQQIILLETLAKKFPGVEVFNENLLSAQRLSETTVVSLTKIENENNQIFEAMNLMQFNDINRQKIERVMSVIKKLSNYLNGIFEDETGKPEVQVAKHISGDSTDSLDNEDLDALIAEFND